MTIVQEHYLFHSRDGRAVRLYVPPALWEEKHRWGRLEGWLEYELLAVEEDVEDFDVPELAKQLALDINAGKELYHELKALAGVAEGHGMGEPAKLLRSKAPAEQDWLIPGLIARGGVTLVQGREKLSGKSTLVFSLIGALERREETLFGPPYKERVKTLIITEEPEYAIVDKCNLFDLQDAWIVQDWSWPMDKVEGYTLQEKWVQKLVEVEQLANATGCVHVVIDPLSRIGLVEDEAGRELGFRAEAVSSFAYRSKLGVTVIHHNNKRSDSAIEDRGRGSTSLQAAVDQIVQIERRGRKHMRRRYATSWGRVKETDWERAFELAEDGKTYTSLDPNTDLHEELNADLLMLKSLANGEATVSQFCEALCLDPEESKNQQAARRRLDKLVDAGYVEKDQEGRSRVYVVKEVS